MGTSKNGQPPFSLSDVQPIAGEDTFGSGGSNVAPNQGVPAMGAVLLDIMKRHAKQVASPTALQAIVSADRADGQLILTLDTYTLWAWEPANATAADATHIAPTDVGAGAGRFVAVATTPVAAATDSTAGTLSAADKTKLDSGNVIAQASLHVTAATVAALGGSTTGHIDFAAALPAGARFLGAVYKVNTKFQNAGDTATIDSDLGDGTTADLYLGDADLHTTGEKFAGDATAKQFQDAGAVTPRASFTASVNLNLITAGDAVAKIFYVVSA